jgi:hypothetical protein
MSTKTTSTENKMSMAKLRLLVLGMVIGSIVISGVPFILPKTPFSQTDVFLQLAIISLALAALGISAAILFILGLKSFTDTFKKTYYYLCGGLVLEGIGSLLYPAAIYFGLAAEGWINFLGNAIYTLGVVLMFVGLRHFAKLLDFHTRLASASSALVLAVAAFVIAIGIGQLLGRSLASEPFFQLTQAVILIDAALSLLCMLLVAAIRKRASLFYGRPLLWLLYALCANGVADVLYFAANLLPSGNNASDPTLISLAGLVSLASRVLFLMAGYALIRLTHKEEAPKREASPIDVVVYMAELVSKKADIDPMLDKVRAVTANMPESKGLTAGQKQSLQAVYTQLREYLLHREQLLAFTSASLDRRLAHRFGTIPFSQ